MIIRTNKGNYLKVDSWITDLSCWAWRWNRNEQRFSEYCVQCDMSWYTKVAEADLPKALPRLEIDK